MSKVSLNQRIGIMSADFGKSIKSNKQSSKKKLTKIDVIDKYYASINTKDEV